MIILGQAVKEIHLHNFKDELYEGKTLRESALARTCQYAMAKFSHDNPETFFEGCYISNMLNINENVLLVTIDIYKN